MSRSARASDRLTRSVSHHGICWMSKKSSGHLFGRMILSGGVQQIKFEIGCGGRSGRIGKRWGRGRFDRVSHCCINSSTVKFFSCAA